MEEEKKIKTLSDYYESLPSATAPKKEFVKRLAMRTHREPGTVRLWIKKHVKPSDPEILKIISEETEIPIENLF